MSEVFFIGDLHFGHKSILKYSPAHRLNCTSIEEHDEKLITLWNSRVSEHDLVYLMGDICWHKSHLPKLDLLQGKKILVRGNHDHHVSAAEWLNYVTDVQGVSDYRGHWLSHFPLHPDELWRKKNIHGHVHTSSIRLPSGELDERYINVSVEALAGIPVSFQEILQGEYAARRQC